MTSLEDTVLSLRTSWRNKSMTSLEKMTHGELEALVGLQTTVMCAEDELVARMESLITKLQEVQVELVRYHSALDWYTKENERFCEKRSSLEKKYECRRED